MKATQPGSILLIPPTYTQHTFSPPDPLPERRPGIDPLVVLGFLHRHCGQRSDDHAVDSAVFLQISVYLLVPYNLLRCLQPQIAVFVALNQSVTILALLLLYVPQNTFPDQPVNIESSLILPHAREVADCLIIDVPVVFEM